jgi:cystathionine beta-synthase
MAVCGALEVAAALSDRHVVVVLLPDTGERYLSKLYSDEWMRDNHLLDTRQVHVREVLMGKPGDVPALITVSANDDVQAAIDQIRRHNISQLPVQRVGRLVGCVEEGVLMARVLEDPQNLSLRVEEVMSDPLPVIDADTPVDEAIHLLADRNAFVVQEKEGPVGILTRFDLIEYVSVD